MARKPLLATAAETPKHLRRHGNSATEGAHRNSVAAAQRMVIEQANRRLVAQV